VAEPFVSVVVPTSNRAGLLTDCLAGLGAQDYPRDRYEVVVVDNGSTDGTAAVVAAAAAAGAPAVRGMRPAEPDANAARNAGVDAARGDPICLVDDDTVIPAGWLSALVAGALRNPTAGCLGGPVSARFEHAPPRTCPVHDLAGMTLDEGDAETDIGEVWGMNMAIRRFAFDAVGPFRPGLRWHQEWEWEQRLLAAGGRIVYVPGAGLAHRRGRGDLRVPALAWEFLQRGYLLGTLGKHVPPREAARQAWAQLRHGLRGRCTRGITEAARTTGLLCAALVRRRPAP
jgi:glycosyltransferase involved in cell wall biosynthesis